MTSLDPGAALGNDTMVVSCKVLEPEFTALGLGPAKVVYLDQGLHRYPDDLRLELNQQLAKLEERPGLRRVIMGYGFCGGGLAGLCSQHLELVLPLVHDCIPLLLGRESETPLVDEGGSFYLSPGWIDHGRTPFTEYFITAKKFGHAEAQWVAGEMLKGYREVVLIRTEPELKYSHRFYACQMAALLGLTYREVQGRPHRLEALLTGRAGPGVAALEPGVRVSKEMYPQTGLAATSGGQP